MMMGGRRRRWLGVGGGHEMFDQCMLTPPPQPAPPRGRDGKDGLVGLLFDCCKQFCGYTGWTSFDHSWHFTRYRFGLGSKGKKEIYVGSAGAHGVVCTLSIMASYGLGKEANGYFACDMLGSLFLSMASHSCWRCKSPSPLTVLLVHTTL